MRCKHKPKITWGHILLKSSPEDFYECRKCGNKVQNRAPKNTFENSIICKFIVFYLLNDMFEELKNYIYSAIEQYVKNEIFGKIAGIVIWYGVILFAVYLIINYLVGVIKRVNYFVLSDYSDYLQPTDTQDLSS